MLLDDLGDFLSSQGGYTAGTDLFTYGLKPSPDRQLSMYPTGGLRGRGNIAGDSGAYVERPTVQVLARDRTASGAAELANTAFLFLRDVPARDINGVRYYSIVAQQSPSFMVRDEQQREVFVFNVLVHRALTST